MPFGSKRPVMLAFCLAAAVLVISSPARVAGTSGAPRPGHDEPIGTWAWKNARSPVKAVVVGGSISAHAPNLGDYIERACGGLEVRSIAKVGYGAWPMRKRFEAQVLRNSRISSVGRAQERWVIVLGGLNSVGSPDRTNHELMTLFQKAHGAGIRVLGLSLTPWGSEDDVRRWRGLNGVHYQDCTRQVVDFVMGRLTPARALGPYGRSKTDWEPRDLPDIRVDLYDSPLRDAKAAPRAVAALEKEALTHKATLKRLAALPETDRAAERRRILDQAREIPRWYLKRELQDFDHIHPNAEGHRLIARLACPSLPRSWSCDCSTLEVSVRR